MAAVAGDSPEVNLRCEKQNLRLPQLDMELRELQTEPETDTEIRDKVTKNKGQGVNLSSTCFSWLHDEVRRWKHQQERER